MWSDFRVLDAVNEFKNAYGKAQEEEPAPVQDEDFW
jgi:hypothetical protein